MKRRIIVIIGCIALGLVFSLNVRNTLDDYGILNISFVNVVWAQSSNGSSGSGNPDYNPCFTEASIADLKTGYCDCTLGSCHIPVLYSSTISLRCIIPERPSKSECKEGTDQVTYTYDKRCLSPSATQTSRPKLVMCGY